MNKIGLALSGGGFRASLYHLGLIRFLRDAGILPQVSHITSVSGGSIIAAHLALNWSRYNGSPEEFDAVAAEFLAFVDLGVRNRIMRRFPLCIPVRWLRRLAGLSNRKLTRTGLLEYHYEQNLYGDTSLFELPETPQLHILTTNLSEGCLCSFNRDGLLMVRRQPGHTFRVDRIRTGLATVSMAVTASSAFPGFFPPLNLTGAEVGANAGEFGRQSYTDGGVFDNLGVRMFRCLERPQLTDSPLSRDDFFDLPAALAALRGAGASAEDTPLRRLAQVLTEVSASSEDTPLHRLARSLLQTGNEDDEKLVLSCLWDVMRHYQFHREPLFAGLKPADSNAAAFFDACRAGGSVPDADDQLWLIRRLLEAAFLESTGRACFRRLNSGLDGVLVSDVGKRIEVKDNPGAGGLIRTALRATDILMDRVWQLENETFRGAAGFVFAPITDVVEPGEDPTAMHPEIQRQAANMRTDLDRFSPLEISSLVRHGYCVGRKACRSRPDLFGAKLPDNAPWDPIPESLGVGPAAPAAAGEHEPPNEPTPTTVEARTLQKSAMRRIWGTLLDRRDWTSYVYVPLLVPLFILLPYFVGKYYEQSQRTNQLIQSFSQGSPDLTHMSHLLDTRSVPYTGEAFEKVEKVVESDFKGVEIFQDSRIIDLRNWQPDASGKSDPASLAYGYRRQKVYKQLDYEGDNVFYVNLTTTDCATVARFPRQRLHPKFYMGNLETLATGETRCRWQAPFDLRQVPAGEFVDLISEHYSPGGYLQRRENGTTLPFVLRTPTAELTTWILMPTGKEYRDFRILRHETGRPEKSIAIRPVTEYLSDDATVIAFKLLALKPGYTYEVNWSYK